MSARHRNDVESDGCLQDQKVNRLEDSLVLWKSVVSNRLLAHVNLVLFLNKCDLLQSKLDAGVRLNRHMISYGDRPNDYDSVSKCTFRSYWEVLSLTNQTRCRFQEQVRGYSPDCISEQGSGALWCVPTLGIGYILILLSLLLVHFTTVTDTRQTATIISTGKHYRIISKRNA